MFAVLLLICLGLTCVVLYLKMKEKHKYFQTRGIPYVKPFFIFGFFGEAMILREDILSYMKRIYNSFPDEKVIGVFQGMNPAYFIRDPEVVNKILIKDFSHFHDRGIPVDEETNPLEAHLFNMSGTKWKTLRNKLSPTFTSGKLKGMCVLMEECVNNFLSYLDDVNGEEVEVKEILSRLTTDVIGSCAFGIDSDAIKNPECDFRRICKKITAPSAIGLIKQGFRFFFPSVALYIKLKIIPNEVHNFFTNITRQNFEQRLKTGTKRNDFMQLLLQLREKGEIDIDPEEPMRNAFLRQVDDNVQDHGKLVFTDELLTAQAFIFFIAGFDTTASNLTFTLYFLSKNQSVQDKIRDEIKEVKNKHGGFSYMALKEMNYLDACVKEGLRLYPPIPLLFRTCTKTFPLDDGTTIEKGNFILIPSASIQRDPKYFTDPEQFNPERFLNQTILPGTFITFGDGPRVCIAQRFALMELKLVVAKLLDRFKIETCPRMKQNEPLKLDPKSLILTPEKGIFCKFTQI